MSCTECCLKPHPTSLRWTATPSAGVDLTNTIVAGRDCIPAARSQKYQGNRSQERKRLLWNFNAQMLSKTSFDKCFANARCSNYYSVQHGDQSSFISATCAHLTHTAANLREGSGFISPSIICRIKARVCDVLCNVSFLVYVHLCSVSIPCQLLLFCYNCVISSGSMYFLWKANA